MPSWPLDIEEQCEIRPYIRLVWFCGFLDRVFCLFGGFFEKEKITSIIALFQKATSQLMKSQASCSIITVIHCFNDIFQYQFYSSLIVKVLLKVLATLHGILPNHTVCFKGLTLTTNTLEKSGLQFILKPFISYKKFWNYCNEFK